MELQSEKDFYSLIHKIRQRDKETLSGYWFNLIKYKDCQFIQGNINDEKSEVGINRNLATLTDEIRPDDIKGFWPEISGYPIYKPEEEILVKYMSALGENDIEIIIPERDVARPVDWDRFDSTGEFRIYSTFIYPAIIDVLTIIEFHRFLDMGCGSGNLIQAIKKSYPDAECYGIDINDKNIEATEENELPNIYLGDSEKINDILPDGLSFDVIIFCGLLNKQVTTREESTKILANSLQRLKKGGHIIMTGYSACYLTANNLTSMGIQILRKSIPENIFKDYFHFYLRQLYLGRKL
jgi:2-polyprenyl-3-methyl-5-hydroxy-6-metoxy-1,4-benzoquinol methylase